MNLESFVTQARIIAKEVVSKEAETADVNGAWVAATMNALKESGLTALVVPDVRTSLKM